MKIPAGVAVAATALSGCAYFTPPIQNPIIEQHAQDRINTFAVIPSRRVMIVKSDKREGEAERRMTICAEAPADVSDNVAGTFAASIAAAGPSSGQGPSAASGQAAIASTIQTLGQFLFKRSQGIQLFRDRSYHLCQARMNDFITDAQYYESTNKLMEMVVPLIQAELATLKDAMPSNQAPQGTALTAPTTSAGPDGKGARTGK